VISLQYGINLNSKTQKTDSEEMYNDIVYHIFYMILLLLIISEVSH